MPGDDIQRLAKIFLSAYRPRNATTAQEIGQGIEPKLRMIEKTLPEHEIKPFQEALQRLIDEIVENESADDSSVRVTSD